MGHVSAVPRAGTFRASSMQLAGAVLAPVVAMIADVRIVLYQQAAIRPRRDRPGIAVGLH